MFKSGNMSKFSTLHLNTENIFAFYYTEKKHLLILLSLPTLNCFKISYSYFLGIEIHVFPVSNNAVAILIKELYPTLTPLLLM